MKQKLTYFYSLLLTAFFLLPWSGVKADPVAISKDSPYTNNFNSETGNAVPSDWTKVVGWSDYPSVQTNNDFSGYTKTDTPRKALIFNGGSNYEEIIAFPAFSNDIKYLTAEFYYKTKSSSAGPAVMSAGYTTSLTDKSKYVSKQSLSYSSDGWTKVTLTFDENTPDGAYIAIYFKGTNSTSSKKGILAIEDVTVTTSYEETTPPAGGPALSVADGETAITSGYSYNFGLATAGTEKEFTLSNPGTESVTLNIEGTNGYGVSPANVTIAAGESETLTVSMASATASGVVTITPDGLDAFTINVNGVVKDPARVFETLLAGAKPTGWTTAATSGSWTWSTTNGAATSAWYASNNARLISPKLTVASGEVFYFEAQGTYDGYQGVMLEYSANGTDWTASSTSVVVTNAWQSYVISDIPAGDFYIALHGNQVRLRNFYGGVKIPDCEKPTALTVDNITFTSARVSWTSEASNFALEYSTDGTNWTAVTEAITNPFVLEGLTPNATPYYVRVRTICEKNESNWVVSELFHTNCQTKTIGWTENFNGTSVPGCWSIDNLTIYGWSKYNYTDETGSYCMEYKASGTSGSDELLETPSITLSDKAVLTFYLKTSTSAPTLKVFVSKDGGNTKVEKASYSDAVKPKALQTVDLSDFNGETVIIYFQGTSSGSSQYAYIDDVTITYKPAAVPANVEASATTDGAVVTWECEENGPFQLHYRAVGDENWTAVSEAINAKTYTLTGLGEAEYEVEVRNYASANRYSAWVAAAATFTPQCPNVTEVTYANPSYNGVTVNWEADGVDAWSLRYKATDVEEWSVVNAIAGNTYAITGLTTGKTYSVEVKAACKAEAGYVAAAPYTPQYGVPSNVQLSAVKDVTATLAWDAVEGATSYEYVVLEGDVDADFTNAESTTEASGELTNLSAATIYSVYVRAMYGDNHGDASEKAVLTTIAYAPTGLEQTAHSTVGASFDWIHNAEGAATRYEVVVMDGTDTPDENTVWTLLENDVTTYTVTGKEDGHKYAFYVRSYYAAGKVSAYESLPFTTDCGVKQTPFFETFNNGTPLCWTAPGGAYDYWNQTGNQGWKLVQEDGEDYVLRCTSTNYLANPSVLTLPQIALPTGKFMLSFKVRTTYSNNTVSGKVTVSAEGVADREAVLTESSNLTLQQIDLTDFAGKTITVKFQTTSYVSSGRLDLDDIRVVRTEIFSDADDNETTFATLAGETIDVILNRTLLYNGDYNTFCLPFSLSAEQLANSPLKDFKIKAFDYASVTDTLMIAITNASSIEAGVPYFIAYQGNSAPADNSTHLFQDVVITTATPGQSGQSDLIYKAVFDPVDLAAQSTEPGADHNELFLAAGNKIYWPAQNKTVKGFRAYFQVMTGGPLRIKPGMPARIVERAEIATGCENVNAEGKAVKLLENDQVVIIRNGVKYNIQGQVISK